MYCVGKISQSTKQDFTGFKSKRLSGQQIKGEINPKSGKD